MPQTLRLHAESAADIERAAHILRRGGTVAFPTETVYGLGANALDPAAVKKIFTAKRRPSWDPLIVHLASATQLESFSEIDEIVAGRVRVLADRFWPGPLTVLLPKSASLPDTVSAGRRLAGFRVPNHPVALALLKAASLPLAAPSANLFSHVSPTTAEHVYADLDGRIDAVLDGGPTQVGVESTVLDVTQTPMVLYRPGAVTALEISNATGVDVSFFEPQASALTAPPESLPSPGVGLRHYAPMAKVVLVELGENDLREMVERAEGKPGVLLPRGWPVPANAVIEQWGSWAQPAELAAGLFAGLRALDTRGVDVIFCPLPSAGGITDAIRDRLMKAAKTE